MYVTNSGSRISAYISTEREILRTSLQNLTLRIVSNHRVTYEEYRQ